MKYSKFPWVSAIIMAGTVEAAANDRPSQSEEVFQTSIRRNVMLLPPKPVPGKFKAQYNQEEIISLPSLGKMRVIREPLNEQSQVVITTSPRDVIAVPNSTNARMRVIVPPTQKQIRQLTPKQ